MTIIMTINHQPYVSTTIRAAGTLRTLKNNRITMQHQDPTAMRTSNRWVDMSSSATTPAVCSSQANPHTILEKKQQQHRTFPTFFAKAANQSLNPLSKKCAHFLWRPSLLALPRDQNGAIFLSGCWESIAFCLGKVVREGFSSKTS